MNFIYEEEQLFGFDINELGGKINQITSYIMSATIHNTGNGNTINTGNNNHIDVTNNIQKGDLGAFQMRLKEIGVEPDEIEEISRIVQTEEPDGNNLGPKASGWIGKMFSNVLSGTSKIGVSAAGNLLATAVKAYFNIS